MLFYFVIVWCDPILSAGVMWSVHRSFAISEVDQSHGKAERNLAAACAQTYQICNPNFMR